MTEEITMDQIMEELRGKIGFDYKQHHMAKELGVSLPFVSATLTGKVAVSGKFLKFIGVEKVVTTTYVKKSQ